MQCKIGPDLFPGKLNLDGDLAERTLNPWFKSISSSMVGQKHGLAKLVMI